MRQFCFLINNFCEKEPQHVFCSARSFIVLVVIFISSYSVKGQSYEPFIDMDKRWHMTRTIYNTQIYTYAARIKKIDTLIDGKVYQKIVSDTIYLLPENESAGYLGFIREDTTSKKVYYTNTDVGYPPFQFNTNEERLLYDFSLEIGDTATVMTTEECNNDGSGFTSLKVLNIDSLELIDGSKRKRWFLEDINNGDEVYWVEGIGSQYGLYITSCPFTSIDAYKYSLLCYYEGETHLYQEPGETECGVFWTSSTDEFNMKEKGIVVFPNPTSGNTVFSIESEDMDNLSIIITNLQGKVIKILDVTSKQVNYNLGTVADGTYLVHLVRGDAIQSTRKLIYAK